MSQMREFVKEADIYKRERLVNLRIVPYVTSKIWVAMVLALWHALAYAILQYVGFKMPGGVVEFFQVYITLVLAVITGMMLGLLASALAANAGFRAPDPDHDDHPADRIERHPGPGADPLSARSPPPAGPSRA